MFYLIDISANIWYSNYINIFWEETIKKNILLILAIMSIVACIFAITASAATVTSIDEIATAISNANDGEALTFDLGANLIIPNQSSGIIISKSISVTINTNGYLIYANPGSNSAGSVYGFLLNSIDAKLTINGSMPSVDYKNYTDPVDVALSLSNGEIVNSNEEGVMIPDFTSNGPAVVVKSGSLELNNMYIRQTHSGEWAIAYIQRDGEYAHNFKANNCIIRSNSSKYTALGVRNRGGTVVESVMQIENSVLYGIGEHDNTDSYLSCGIGSYLRNVRIADYTMTIDANNLSSAILPVDENPIVLENVIFEHSKAFKICTGRIDLKLIDCTFAQDASGNSTFSVHGDGAGIPIITVINAATCSEAGNKKTLNATGTYTNFEGMTLDEEYSALNPAKGHKYVKGEVSANYCPLGAYFNVECSSCDYSEILNWETKEKPSVEHSYGNVTSISYPNGYMNSGVKENACSNPSCNSKKAGEATKALFTYLGYSRSETSAYICVGYQIEMYALAEYKTYNPNFEYGFVVALEKTAPSGQPLNVVDGNVCSNGNGGKVIYDFIETNGCSAIDIKLIGDFTGREDTLLLMSAFVFDGEKLSYLQDVQSDTVTSVAIR